MADKTKKLANSFWNTCSKSMLSKEVISIKWQVMDTLKWEKRQFFTCSNIAQITSEICVISRRPIFDIKIEPDPYQNRERESILHWQLWVNILVFFDFGFFFADHHHNSRHWIWYWQNANNHHTCQLWAGLHCVNVAKSLLFVIYGAIKNASEI